MTAGRYTKHEKAMLAGLLPSRRNMTLCWTAGERGGAETLQRDKFAKMNVAALRAMVKHHPNLAPAWMRSWFYRRDMR